MELLICRLIHLTNLLCKKYYNKTQMSTINNTKTISTKISKKENKIYNKY